MKPLETPLNSTQKLKYAAVRNILFMFLNLIKKKKKKAQSLYCTFIQGTTALLQLFIVVHSPA